MPLGFHPEARAEAIESARYYERQQARLGKKFSIALRDGLRNIGAHPRLYPQVHAGCRKALLRHFPYAVIYREQKDAIQIVAIMHLRRNPGYWTQRLT